jgi:lysophospholipase L1-like esterase
MLLCAAIKKETMKSFFTAAALRLPAASPWSITTMVRHSRSIYLIGFLLLATCRLDAQSRPSTSVSPQTTEAVQHWVATWGASQQVPEPRNMLPADDLTDATVRQIVHLTIGGETLRVRLSNAFGTAPLHLGPVHIARPLSPASGRIVPGSDRALTFSGTSDVTIPAGAEYLSDPVAYPMAPLSDLAITFYEEKPPVQETSHPGSRATTYYVHGNQVSAEGLSGVKTTEHWYTIAGLDVTADASASALVTLGDSITDGHAATTNGNDRWPDVLARSLQANAKTRNIAVVNAGTGGNRLLNDGLGPNALARFDRDVLARVGVRYVLIFEGVNDLGTLHSVPAVSDANSPSTPANSPLAQEGSPAPQRPPAPRFAEATPEQHEQLVSEMIAAYAQMIFRAHAAGLRAIGATITPFGGSMYGRSPANEADRQKINGWILAPGNFDSVVDFANVVADPQDAAKMAPQFDSGDHLHPSPAGYKAIGESIPPALFQEQRSSQSK